MEFGEYDNFGTIYVHTKDKTIVYKLENNEQSRLYYKCQDVNRALYYYSAILPIKAIILIFLGAIGRFLFPKFTIYIYLIVFAYVIYNVYLIFNLTNVLNILTSRVNKEIPHTVYYTTK